MRCASTARARRAKAFRNGSAPSGKKHDVYYAGFDAERKKRTLKPLPGAPELLRWLKAQEIPLFVVSNKRGDYLRAAGRQAAMADVLRRYRGRPGPPRDKPAREHVDHVLAFGGIAPGADIWFVGDSETDMLCAKNAGLTPVLIGEEAEATRLSVALTFRDCAGLHALLSSYAGETDRHNA